MLSRSAASTPPCLTGKPPIIGTVRCSSSSRSNQFTKSIEELEKQLGAGILSGQATAHGAQSLKHSKTPPTPLVPPLRRPSAPPLELQEAHAEKASVARGASPIQLTQLAQQLRIRVRAVQDLVERCPQLLSLSAWQLDAAVMGLASELGISSARALFMVSKDPFLLFMGRAGASLQEACNCEGGSNTSTSNLGCITNSSSDTSRGSSSKSSTSRRSSSKSRQHEPQLSCESSALPHPWVGAMIGSTERLSGTDSKRPAGGTPTSSNSRAHGNFGVHAPNASPAARAASLAQALGVSQEEVVRLATSAPSVLSRPPGPLAERFRRLGEVLEGVPMARVLRMAAEEPSYLSYRPPSIDRRIQAMRLLFRKPRHKIVHMLTRQPDLVFMSPRILHNKLKVLQRIFNKEPRLVIPIIMRTPKLLRTDMDKVRECYELLEGLMGLPSRSYTFAMVCHAPAMLLEGKTRLVGRFRCISHAKRGAPHWAKQWRKLYPAQRADCMLVTPVTYSRLEFLLATGQARSMRMYDALMMARSDFSHLFPTFRPIPIRRPAAAPHAAPARPANPIPALHAASACPTNISSTSVAPAFGSPHTPQHLAHTPHASTHSTHPRTLQHAAHPPLTPAASTPNLPQGSLHTSSLSGSPPSHIRGSAPSNAPFTSGAPAALPNFGSPPAADVPAPSAAAPTAVPLLAGSAAAVSASVAASVSNKAAAASDKARVGPAQPPPPPPWTPVGAPSYASSMPTPVLPNTAPPPVPINHTTHPPHGASNGASSRAPDPSLQQQHLQQQQLRCLNHQLQAQQHAAPYQGSRQPHHDHTHQPHSTQHQHQHQQHLPQHHHNGQVLSQLPSSQDSSELQGHVEGHHGSGVKFIGHRGSRRMRHSMMQQQQQQQQQQGATLPQHAQTKTQHTDLSSHLPPLQHPVLVTTQPWLTVDGSGKDTEGTKGSNGATEDAACGVVLSHTVHASDLLPLAAPHPPPQPAAPAPHTSHAPTHTVIHTAAHSAPPAAKQTTAHVAMQQPQSEVAAVCAHGSHLHVRANGTAVHARQGEVIQGLTGQWRNPRPLQPAQEFSAVAYAVRQQLQLQGRLEPQHAPPVGSKDVHKVSPWEGQRAGSSWRSRAGTEHRSGSDSSSRDGCCTESTDQGNSSSSSSSSGAESGGSDGNEVHHCQESSSLQVTGKRDGKQLQESRQQGNKASMRCTPG